MRRKRVIEINDGETKVNLSFTFDKKVNWDRNDYNKDFEYLTDYIIEAIHKKFHASEVKIKN